MISEQEVVDQRQERRLGAKGQGNAWRTIINQIPPHETYIEAFAGWGVVMLQKRRASSSILIDKDPARILNLQLELSTAMVPPRTATAESPLGSENSAIRNPQFEFVTGDCYPFLAAYPFRGNEFVYADPPYLLEKRTSGHRYLFEMADDPMHDAREHRALLELLKRLPCPVMISGYWSELYADVLSDWRTLSFTGITRGGPREEWLWMNYPPPVELHDYRWLGNNHRERTDLNRMKRRWVNKLANMPILKRQALLAAIQESDRQK